MTQALTRLRAHVEALVGERHPLSSPAHLDHAERYLAETFHGLALDVSTHSFDALGGRYRNVIATMPGRCPDTAPLLIAAHYDTVQGSPGADDNASGLAVLLEAARRLMGAPLSRPVRFIGFCLEEDNLMGSLAYAEHLRATEQAIHGAIVLECVGYASSDPHSQRTPPNVPIPVPSVGDFLAIVGNSASAELAAAVDRSFRQQEPGLKTLSLIVPDNGERLPDTRRSDHAAFWHYGYPAVMLTDTANFRNRHYHRPTDTLDTLSFPFMEQVVRGVAATAVHLAGTISEPRVP